jgi:hypothetical protein
MRNYIHTTPDNDTDRDISERHKSEQYRDSNMAPMAPTLDLTTTAPSCMQQIEPSSKARPGSLKH